MPVTFRCYQCNQVLRTAKSKVGAVVACPKCGTELVVPEPAEKTPASGEPGGAIGAETDPGELIRSLVNTGPPPEVENIRSLVNTGPRAEVENIRPEDIRVEPGVAPRPPAPNRTTRVAAEPPQPSRSEPPAPSFEVRLDQNPEAAPRTRAVEPDPDFPPIKIAPQPIRSEPAPSAQHSPLPRPRDIVLPRTAVVAWSLFVLLALALSFLAGLLAGHFLWIVRVVQTA